MSEPMYAILEVTAAWVPAPEWVYTREHPKEPIPVDFGARYMELADYTQQIVRGWRFVDRNGRRVVIGVSGEAGAMLALY